MSLFISSKPLLWSLEKGIMERINIEKERKRHSWEEECLSLLGNESQQVKIFSMDVFKILIRDREGSVFPGCFCHDLYLQPLATDTSRKELRGFLINSDQTA